MWRRQTLLSLVLCCRAHAGRRFSRRKALSADSPSAKIPVCPLPFVLGYALLHQSLKSPPGPPPPLLPSLPSEFNSEISRRFVGLAGESGVDQFRLCLELDSHRRGPLLLRPRTIHVRSVVRRKQKRGETGAMFPGEAAAFYCGMFGRRKTERFFLSREI